MIRQKPGFALILFAVMVLTGAQVIIKSRLTVHGVVRYNQERFPPIWIAVCDWQKRLAGLQHASIRDRNDEERCSRQTAR